VPAPARLGFHHVTAVQETKINVSLWHIARISHTSRKSFGANHAGMKKNAPQESSPIIRTSLRRLTPVA
jgi:hypothetical protein